MLRSTTLALLFLVAVPSPAEEVKIVLWNAKAMFGPGAATSRSSDLEAFGTTFSDADIIILDEVTSLETVDAVRDEIGFASSHSHTACSDFNQNDNNTFSSLEVGFISRLPLANVIEFDPSPDNTGATGEPAEQALVRVGTIGGSNVADRGFLTARVPSLGLTILATHLKSSGGGDEASNARKREFVAAAMARFVAQAKNANPNETLLVAGDLNVGERDKSKIGYHLTEDNDNPDDGSDGYDDTHAIFSHGRVDGLHMASLTKGIVGETYDDDRFAGSGPIDCMYVVGKQTGGFTLASKSDSTFGSDHFAVSTRFFPDSDVDTSGGGTPPPTPTTADVVITACLPNPTGIDPGNETVTLKNNSADAVQITGWTIRDESNNSVSLTGSLAADEERTIALGEGELPLNNGGDELTLFDSSGTPVHSVSYSSAQATPGANVIFQ